MSARSFVPFALFVVFLLTAFVWLNLRFQGWPHLLRVSGFGSPRRAQRGLRPQPKGRNICCVRRFSGEECFSHDGAQDHHEGHEDHEVSGHENHLILVVAASAAALRFGRNQNAGEDYTYVYCTGKFAQAAKTLTVDFLSTRKDSAFSASRIFVVFVPFVVISYLRTVVPARYRIQ